MAYNPHNISVIIPVYQAERYIEKTIDSVLRQDIGFENNIQLILVNDGSTDSSEDICIRFRDAYPENIVYIKQDNFGVSSARNNGLRKSTGKYVHFLDSDDLISKDYYSRSLDFLNKNMEVDFVASKICFFDAIIDSHPLNYKFTNNQIIDVSKDPNNPILHMATCVFRRDAIADLYFDKRLKISEDLTFLNQVLNIKKKYGVLKRSTYFYRKRSDGNSAIDGKLRDKTYYTVTPNLSYKGLMDLWTDKDGVVHQYMQHLILYEMSYRLRQKTQSVLSPKEENTYKKTVREILNKIDYDVVCSRKDFDINLKKYILGNRFNDDTSSSVPMVNVDFVDMVGDHTLRIEGYLEGAIEKNGLIVQSSGVEHRISGVDRVQRAECFLGDLIYDGGGFKLDIPVNGGHQDFTFAYRGKQCHVSFGIFSSLGELKSTYSTISGLLIKRINGGFSLNSYNRFKVVLMEFRHCLRIVFDWRTDILISRVNKLFRLNLKQLNFKAKIVQVVKPFLFSAEAIATIPEAIYLRIAYRIKKNYKKPIWLISDRAMSAGDNGEALFRYIKNNSIEGVEVYFVISKKSVDYSRIKEVGPVVDHSSIKHKLLMLTSEKVISSHADIEVTNPFLRQQRRYVDLMSFDFVFLQHGVIKNDLSNWLNRYEKNIKLFITSSKSEYDSIFNYPYYYDKNTVILSGLPRFDYLINRPKSKIVIAPTYRTHLISTRTNRYGLRPYDANFIKSDYFTFYNRLINENRLIDVLDRFNVEAELYLHPNFAAQIVDFEPSGPFKIMNYPYNYNRALSEGSLLVSDYSSIVFDFAYMKKPIIYTKFDENTFFASRDYTKDSFYSDESNGFGVITYTYDSLVSEIIKVVESGFDMEEVYVDRVDKFFYTIDNNNSKRVLDAIINMNSRSFYG